MTASYMSVTQITSLSPASAVEVTESEPCFCVSVSTLTVELFIPLIYSANQYVYVSIMTKGLYITGRTSMLSHFHLLIIFCQ